MLFRSTEEIGFSKRVISLDSALADGKRLSGETSVQREAIRTRAGSPGKVKASSVTRKFISRPREKMSLRVSVARNPRCSGEAYWKLPMIFVSVVFVGSYSREIPKSIRWILTSDERIIFCGLISL